MEISQRLLMFILGRILLGLGLALLLPLSVSVSESAPAMLAFGMSSAGLLLLGALLCYVGREHRRYLNVREGAVFMVLVWFVMGAVGMVPYVLLGVLDPLDAFFESVSCFTTTGATCLGETASPSLVLWRTMTQWLGGLNILALIVTVVPQVAGCFGLSLAARQDIGASQTLHRMQQNAVGAAQAYVLFTIFAALLYILCGMGGFDALNWALVTLPTGGRYESAILSAEGSALQQGALMLCMLLASGNFLLYWRAGKHRRWRDLAEDTEFRTFLGVVLFFGLVVSLHLWYVGLYDAGQSLRMGFFHVISFASTTGVGIGDFAGWPDFERYVLFILVFAGGCIGSSTGGLKILRLLVLFKLAAAELRRTLHPRMVVDIKVDYLSVPAKVRSRILNFFFLYMAVFALAVLLICLSGLPVIDAMGVAASCLSSVGAAAMLTGGIESFGQLAGWVKLLCCFLMILGRLEIFSFLIVLQSGIKNVQNKW